MARGPRHEGSCQNQKSRSTFLKPCPHSDGRAKQRIYDTASRKNPAIDIRDCVVDARRDPSPGKPIKDNCRAALVGRLLTRPGIAVATPFCRALTSKNLFEANLIDGVVDPLDRERTGGKL
ncbi:MAG: hypothetical protein CR217_02815 [Beijerinckiaceae bacterium]|nr:MAG: hypothetical protein CR217_02815 [Beijerinckiaceae bacterium]